jgi:G3E family GTPase
VHHTTFEAFAFRSTGVFAEEALEDLLRALPRSVYRVKGLVRSDGDDAWVLVNSVAGRFEMEPLSRAPPPDQSALVFIGRDLEREDLSRRCREIVRDG